MNLLGEEDAQKPHKLAAGIQVIIIPVLNVDGLAELAKIYQSSHIYRKIRKNRHIEGASADTPSSSTRPESQGVDLNRNWGVHWYNEKDDPFAFDEKSAEYHGKKPLSEPETQALKKFLDKHEPTLRYVFSFHSYGNFFCIPFNFDPVASNPELEKKLPFKAEKYQFFRDHFHLPKGLM